MKQQLRALTHLRNRYLLSADTIGLLVIPSLALLLRTESVEFLLGFWEAAAVYTLAFIVVKWVVFYSTGLYGELWAYASVAELLTVIRAVGFSAIIEILLCFLLLLPLGYWPEGLPRSLPFLSALLTAFYVTGIRFLIRVLYAMVSRREQAPRTKPVLIAGAGAAGIMVARELQTNLQLGLDPVGFVDDDPQKISKRVCGIPVFGPISEIPWVVSRHGIREVIIAMPAAPGGVVRRVLQLCKQQGVPSKITPGLFDILRGAARVASVREIQLEDLLRREVIEPDPADVRSLLTGARVLITGAGGSIGSEIVRQVGTYSPSEIVILGHGETSVFHIIKELEERSVPGVSTLPVVADIRDFERMSEIFSRHKPQVVFHAAAHKHVWLMEQNVADAITNNVLGTRNLVDLSDRHGVHRFVMISSDKAVNPTSVMGVTKRIAELIVQDAANRTRRGFVTVRFGNVLGSRGSVVPIFKHQIESGGPVTVTHPEARRYFMTIPEAVHLVLQAGSMGTGGEIFVLDMGEPLRVLDVARDMIRLSGYAEEDIGITITGLKPGEKMCEELFYCADDNEPTTHSKVRVTRHNYAQEYESRQPGGNKRSTRSYETHLRMDVNTLIEAAHEGNVTVMASMLKKIVPQFIPGSEHFDARGTVEHEQSVAESILSVPSVTRQ